MFTLRRMGKKFDGLTTSPIADEEAEVEVAAASKRTSIVTFE